MGERYIIQPDKTSSSEYQILDVLNQSVVANGLTVEEAREGIISRNKIWQQELLTYGQKTT